jgi:hypothetical protein
MNFYFISFLSHLETAVGVKIVSQRAHHHVTTRCCSQNDELTPSITSIEDEKNSTHLPGVIDSSQTQLV